MISQFPLPGLLWYAHLVNPNLTKLTDSLLGCDHEWRSVMPMRTRDPEFSDEEIHQLLREIEQQSLAPTPDARIKRPQAYSSASVRREPTLDEILKKIQHDIENG